MYMYQNIYTKTNLLQQLLTWNRHMRHRVWIKPVYWDLIHPPECDQRKTKETKSATYEQQNSNRKSPNLTGKYTHRQKYYNSYSVKS